MSVLNRLPDETLRTADRAFAWVLVLFGYIIAMALAVDPAGWDDPVFTVVRKLPGAPYSWAGLLAFSTTVYMVGEILVPETYRRRGTVAIAGAIGCAAWALAMALAMSRMVYMMPSRITLLWPLVMCLIAVLFLLRAIGYANAFTGKRWNTNPYQLWTTTFLISASIAQIVIGAAPSSVFTEVERPVQLQLALVNFMGGAVVMFGLHLRNKDKGQSLEMSGTASLVLTLAWYVYETLHRNMLAGTTLGFALSEAFVFASLHRSVQIASLRRAERRGKPQKARKLRSMLDPEIPGTEREVKDVRHGR